MSALDQSKLEKVKHKDGGIVTARCPVCAEQGHDKTGNHLSIFPNGRFGCVQFPRSEGVEHRKRIFALVGVPDEKARAYPTIEEAIASQERQLKMKATRRDHYNSKFVVVRFDAKEGDKQFRPFHLSNAGWIVKDPPGKLPLFNLAQLGERQTEKVYVVEGEKCACTLSEQTGVIVTTSSHGAKSADKTDWTPLAGREVIVLPDQNLDGIEYAQKVADIASNLDRPAKVNIVELPDLPPKGDCVDWLQGCNGQSRQDKVRQLEALVRAAEEEETPVIAGTSEQPREPRIRFFTPSELRDFKPDNELVLVGDCQITRGEVFVIGGEPGVGKSLASTQLAVDGATQRDWFGLKVHRQFRTMIVQTENGRYRLQLEFSKRDCDEIENWVRISEPPPFGLTLTNSEFREDIRVTLDSFRPECVIFDPWNAAARDDKQRDYVETFDALRNLLPTGSDKPALGVIAHTRKPQPKEKRTGGTGLMHLLAGSYVLTSVPRSIFIMTRGSEDETDNSVVLFNPKNSNGQNAARSAWIRALNGFTPAADFDWREFDQAPEERKIIALDQISEVFAGGKKLLYLSDAAHDLATLANVRDTSAYRALKLDGKFAEYLSQVGENLKFSLPSSLGILGERKKGFDP